MPQARFVLLFVTFFFFPASSLHASSPTYDVNTVEPGGLYFATDKPGRVVRAPSLAADVVMTVSGPIIRTQVTQRFENKSDAWVEGIYTYPLPKGSAIDVLKMQVGNRVIEGEIQEKAEAKATFERARNSGKRASLIVQRRPNIFSTRLANIGPGEVIKITIEYQDLIEPRDNIFQLRFPMVVRPRYNPGEPLDDRQARLGWGFDTDEVPDGSKITQPLFGDTNQNHNPVSMKITLNPGFEMENLTSPSHEISIIEQGRSAEITLANGNVPADQDFILRWRPKANAAPQIGMFHEETAQGEHHLLMLIPPTTLKAVEAAPRELVIVLDKSGSMGGQAIRQAKSAVRRAVMRLQSGDTFNIIAFDNTSFPLFAASQPVTERSIDTALDFVANIKAGGGTEMSSALGHALANNDADEADQPALKQIIFVTDGAVGNEVALMTQIKTGLGTARLFMVGIGSAPNNYFMSEAAHFGRGTFINIAMQDDVLNAMARLFAKIERPQLTNIKIEGLQKADMTPAIMPDLYDGEPIVIAYKTADGGHGDLEITGERGGKPWSMIVPKAQGGSAQGVANLWARRKIQMTNRSFIGNHSNDAFETRRSEVLALALGYHLVSEFTSLVAVEQNVVRDPADPLYKREVAANLPAGMDWKARKRRTINHGLMQASAQMDALPVRARGTASPMMLLTLSGFGLLLASLVMALLMRRRQRSQ